MLPVRTCLGCRQRAAKTDLIRVVGRGGQVVHDRAHRLSGRGGYLHPRAGCLQLALKRRAFGRALREPGLDPTGLSEELTLLEELSGDLGEFERPG